MFMASMTHVLMPVLQARQQYQISCLQPQTMKVMKERVTLTTKALNPKPTLNSTPPA